MLKKGIYMGFYDFFRKDERRSEVKQYSELFTTLKNEFPSVDEDKLMIASCIAGLFARVAYVDFDLDSKELKKMQALIKTWKFQGIDAETISQIAISHIKEMAGLENHLYVKPLNSLLDKDERFNTVKALFLIAASDGSVDNVESEEIRLINKGLELSNQHFIVARAEVSEYLRTLK